MPPVDAEIMTETAYAKVNLALHVRERRADGYHALESLFVFADHGDWLAGEVTADGRLHLRIDGPFGAGLDPGADNLVMKAAHALQANVGESRGATLRLTKNLPVASGIGGGSADAASTLRLLARLWGVSVPMGDMERIALSLGSDVPACLSSVTQMVHGRGEILAQHPVEGLANRPMLLVNPGIGLSTAQVFAGWDRLDRGPLNVTSLDRLIAEGRNDLEAAARIAAPVITVVLNSLAQCDGVRLVRMSGSGATCFALFDTEMAMAAAARIISATHPQWWVAPTRIRDA